MIKRCRTNTVGRGLAPAVTTDKPHIFGGTKAPPYKERSRHFVCANTPININLLDKEPK